MRGAMHVVVRRRSVIAIAAVAVLSVGAVALTAIDGGGLSWDDLPLIVGFGLIVAVGSILVLRVPENAVSWLMLSIPAAVAVMGLAEGVGALAGGRGEVAIEQAMAIVSGAVLFAMILLVAGILPLLFPTGAPPTRRWRWVWMTAVIGYLVIVATVLLEWLGEGFEAAQNVGGELSSLLGLVQFVGLGVWLVAIVGGVVSLAVRWHRSKGVERAQLRWLIPSFTLLMIGVLAEFGGFQDSLVASVFIAFGAVLVPISIGFAITKYHLYDIGRIVSRTVTYAVLAGLIGAAYGFGALWLPTQLGIDSPTFVAATTLAVAAAFNPVRRWLTSHLDRRFNRTPYDPQAVVDGLTADLRDTTDASAISDVWAVTVQNALHPSSISVWTAE